MGYGRRFQIDIEISRPNRQYNYLIKKKKKYWGMRGAVIHNLLQFLIRNKMLCEGDIPMSWELMRRALTTDLLNMPKKWGEVGEEIEEGKGDEDG